MSNISIGDGVVLNQCWSCKKELTKGVVTKLTGWGMSCEVKCIQCQSVFEYDYDKVTKIT